MKNKNLKQFIDRSIVSTVNSRVFVESVRYGINMDLQMKNQWEIDNNYLERRRYEVTQHISNSSIIYDLESEVSSFTYYLFNWDYDENPDTDEYCSLRQNMICNSFHLIANHYNHNYREEFEKELSVFKDIHNIDLDRDIEGIENGVVFLDYDYADIIENLLSNKKWCWLNDLLTFLAGIIFCGSILKSPSLVDIGVLLDETGGPSGSRKITTAQWALYHYVMQEHGAFPSFKKMEEDYQKAAKEYGKHWKGFQQKYNEVGKIIKKDSGLMFKSNDVLMVEKIILNKYPEAHHTFNKLVIGKY